MPPNTVVLIILVTLSPKVITNIIIANVSFKKMSPNIIYVHQFFKLIDVIRPANRSNHLILIVKE